MNSQPQRYRTGNSSTTNSLGTPLEGGRPSLAPYGRSPVPPLEPDLDLSAMGIVRQIGLAVLAISFAVFVSFFGSLPVFRRTPIGFLHRLIWFHIPNGLAVIDRYLTRGRVGMNLRRTGHYLMHEKHPIVLIFFLALLVISEMLFIPAALPLLPITFPNLPWLHHILIALFITPPYLFLHLSHSTSSSITRSNHAAALKRYPYDHTIFHGSNDLNARCAISPTTSPLATQICRTCQLAKPARSKHCSICRACIQKADHHCVWINNCVGRNNYLYFLALMLSLTLLLAYGTYLGYQVLDVQIQLQRPSFSPSSSSPSSTSPINPPHWSKHISWPSYAQQWSGMIADHPLIAAPALLDDDQRKRQMGRSEGGYWRGEGVEREGGGVEGGF
ncbi:hypothetical protein GJ744_005032 [Endocarpon pusillum]|uniref:Palmitoyltransferase n=1 Tax=Endocarpon pusillum TaxID=364733 RepID=A0A8H7A8B4_9EURO|nr:hypothetical protein GJ744_005032 [Endocarpon pusillum]